MRNHFFEMGMLTILLWIAQLQHQAIVVAAWVVVPSSPLDKSQTLRDGTRLFMIPVEDLGNTKQANATMAPVLTPKEGDRVLVDQNEETVATPGFPQKTLTTLVRHPVVIRPYTPASVLEAIHRIQIPRFPHKPLWTLGSSS